MQNHQHYFNFISRWYDTTWNTQEMCGTPMHLQKDIETLIENVRKFGLRIYAKQWDLGYDELMSIKL